MMDQIIISKILMSLFVFLKYFEMTLDACRVFEGAAVYLLKQYLGYLVQAFNTPYVLLIKAAAMVQKGCLTWCSALVIYLLK